MGISVWWGTDPDRVTNASSVCGVNRLQVAEQTGTGSCGRGVLALANLGQGGGRGTGVVAGGTLREMPVVWSRACPRYKGSGGDSVEKARRAGSARESSPKGLPFPDPTVH